jgi:hypothetical protein
MPDFSRIISLAYLRILDRPPDAGGLATYNQAMNAGLTEALMRESLLRSPEYAEKNPGGPAPRAAAAARGASASATSASRRRQPARRR